jgi:hypothetical protein
LFPNDCAVAWREWFNDSNAVLVKNTYHVKMMNKKDLLCTLKK